MRSLIKLIKKEENLNTLLITVFFGFLTIWWAVIFFGLRRGIESSNHAWSSYYQIVAILGAYIGFYIYLHSKTHYEQALPRRVIVLISIGLLFQAFGQTVYLLYAFVLGVEVPHPSYGDVFYLSSVIVYLAAVVAFYIDIITKNDRQKSLCAAFIWLVLLVVAQAVLLSGTKYNITQSLTSILDTIFLIIEPIYAALALGALVGTRFLVGKKYRTASLLLLIGLVSQYIADFYFLYATNVGVWSLTGAGDYLCLFAYFILSLGIVRFTITFIAMNILVVLFNSFFFIQFLLSGSVDRFFSNGIIFVICALVSYFLLLHNKIEVAEKEKLAHVDALAESNRRLQALDKQKTEFLNIAAHQLRTPTSVVNNYLAMIKDGDYGEVGEGLKPVMDNIEASNQWLIKLADKLLYLSKIEQGDIKYHFEACDIVSLIKKIIAEFIPLADEKGLKIVFSDGEVGKPSPHGRGQGEGLFASIDEEKIKLAVFNLLDNAVRYSEEGTIGVVVREEKQGNYSNCSNYSNEIPISNPQISKFEKREAGYTLCDTRFGVSIRVIDQGIGFAPEDKEKFFHKFQRGVNASGTNVHTSTGLGLYLVRKFVEGHNGYVWAKSEGEGKGSEFGFWLPKEQ